MKSDVTQKFLEAISMQMVPQLANVLIFVTLHTKTRLIKHGNLGETEFQKGFQRVSNCRNRVSKGFQIPETGFVKGLQTVSKEFPKGFQRVSNSRNQVFKGASKGFPKGFQRVSKAFSKSFKPLETT